MTSINYLNGSSNETDAARLCRKKARDCQRTALTTADPMIRHRFLHLAKLWREMADDAEQQAKGASEDKGAVIFFPKRSQKLGKASR
jgi:hypothetical protein